MADLAQSHDRLTWSRAWHLHVWIISEFIANEGTGGNFIRLARSTKGFPYVSTPTDFTFLNRQPLDHRSFRTKTNSYTLKMANVFNVPLTGISDGDSTKHPSPYLGFEPTLPDVFCRNLGILWAQDHGHYQEGKYVVQICSPRLHSLYTVRKSCYNQNGMLYSLPRVPWAFRRVLDRRWSRKNKMPLTACLC